MSDVNIKFRQYWNTKHPENPCWTDETDPKKEFRPWKELYDESESSMKLREWIKHYNYGDWRLDFVLEKYSLAVEIDGVMHNKPKNVEKDRRKSNELQMLGYVVLRFSAQTVLQNFSYIEDEILRCLEVTEWVD